MGAVTATRRGAPVRSVALATSAAGCLVLALGPAALGPHPLSAQGTADRSEAVEAADELRESYIAAFNAHDAGRAAAHFAEEGVLLPPHDGAKQGRGAVRRRLRGLFDAQDVTMQTLPEEAWAAGNRVVERGLLFLEIRSEGPDGRVRSGGDTGKYVMVARRTDEGWKIAWLIWNQDHPPREPTGGDPEAGGEGPGKGRGVP